MVVSENCQKCSGASIDIWMASQCRHMICGKCLERNDSIDDCGPCNGTTQKFWCPGRRYGCQVQKTIAEAKDHAKTCVLVPVSCPNECNEALPKRSLPKHLSLECRLRLTECEFCNQGIYAHDLPSHQAICDEVLVCCAYCHEGNIRRGSLPLHARGCSKTPKPCPMKKHGCTFEAVEAEMGMHLRFKEHIACFNDISQKLEQLELNQLIDRRDQRVQGANLAPSQPAAIGGVSLFDREVLWLVKLPDADEPGDLSIIFRQRETCWTFVLEISCVGSAGGALCSQDEESMYSVYMVCLSEGQRKEGMNFAIQAENGSRLLRKVRHSSFVPSGRLSVLEFKCAPRSGPGNKILVKLTSD
ncbi:unnamed protein product [Ixodes hexagonus]